MHIEPGYVSAAKIAVANVAAAALMGRYTLTLVRQPQLVVRTLLAAAFFCLFMASFAAPAGPSELHFIGAMPMYLILGFVPTLLGFGVGLLLQGLFLAPADLVHLGVNTLSLALPLVALHYTVGRRLGEVRLEKIVKLDTVFYGGVTVMVGFWLAVGEVAAPLSAWASFAVSYAPLVLVEPLVTFALLKALLPFADTPALRLCTTLGAPAAKAA